MSNKPKSAKPAMTGWYDLGQLAQTGLKTGLSELLGGMVDTRRFLALESPASGAIFDYSADESFWFDYMADTGDGWDSTYTMAYLLTTGALTVSGKTLARPHTLILGGDEVYPVASRDNYAFRLVWPFNQAARNLKRPAPGADPHATMFCVPGNHDWYDCLNIFYRRFCSHRRLGDFITKQERSYFALKLPHHWHLWAIDIQLRSETDPAQRTFFKNVADSLAEGDRVILCVAEPPVVNGLQPDPNGDLAFGLGLFHDIVQERKARIAAVIAGDTHNYQRYQTDYERPENKGKPRYSYPQCQIVSGGGGAFLHATHSFPKPGKHQLEAKCEKRYPSEDDSRRVARWLWAFPFLNPSMAALLGVVHLFCFWGLTHETGFAQLPFSHPAQTFWLLLLVGALSLLGRARGKWFLGLLHGLLQAAVAYVVWCVALDAAGSHWAALPLQFVASSVLAGLLFGKYLWVSLNWFRCHSNEAFSALREAGYKNFLRISVEHDRVHVYALGVDRIAPEEGAHPVPAHLIEEFDIT